MKCRIPFFRTNGSAVRSLLSFAAGALLLTSFGCASDPMANQRVASYTPQVEPGERMPWKAQAPATDESAAPADAVSSAANDAVSASSQDSQPADAAPVVSAGDSTAASPVAGQLKRVLRRDDHVLISMRGIPRPEELADVVDGSGNVKLPLIGVMHVEGMTTSDAESAIERAYVSSGYYQKIDVILVAQEDSFFVRGAVTRPGKYPLTGDTTLLMAITAAGGYTDFANQKKIRVLRGNEVLTLNGARIEAREDEDCFIEPNDIIVVEKRIF